jgi:hypothetical protein
MFGAKQQDLHGGQSYQQARSRPLRRGRIGYLKKICSRKFQRYFRSADKLDDDLLTDEAGVREAPPKISRPTFSSKLE